MLAERSRWKRSLIFLRTPGIATSQMLLNSFLHLIKKCDVSAYSVTSAVVGGWTIARNKTWPLIVRNSSSVVMFSASEVKVFFPIIFLPIFCFIWHYAKELLNILLMTTMFIYSLNSTSFPLWAGRLYLLSSPPIHLECVFYEPFCAKLFMHLLYKWRGLLGPRRDRRNKIEKAYFWILVKSLSP